PIPTLFPYTTLFRSLAYENVPSERQLLATLPLRLDWLWCLGMDLDSDIPDHSVLSKARRRWGTEAFRSFFQRVIQQANEAGLITWEEHTSELQSRGH